MILHEGTTPPVNTDLWWYNTEEGHFYRYCDARSRWETPYIFEVTNDLTASNRRQLRLQHPHVSRGHRQRGQQVLPL